MNINEEYLKIKENSDKKVNLTLLFTTITIFVYCYFGSFSFFEKTFTNIENIHYWKIIYHNTMAFILFFVISIIFIKFILKDKTKFYNLQRGDYKFGLIIIGLATLLVPIIALTTTLDKGMTSTYPLINFNSCNWWQIILYFTSYILYYIGWEYLFRGLLLNVSKEKLGVLGAILLTTLVSAIIHTSIGALGKPMLETLSAIPAGLIFGYIAYKSNSIYYSLYTHALIGILTDLFIFLII